MNETVSLLKTGDIAIVVLYFILVLGVGFYSLFRANRGTISGYFLAGRLMTWLPVGASLFASNIGSEHFIGLAGSGASTGLSACILIQMLGWVFLPVFIASGVCTLPEYMNRRFGGRRIRTYLACLSMLLYIFTKISVNLYAGALFIQQSLHWNLYPSILFILFLTCLCTVTGGLAAVIYTDTLQTIIMLIGSIILTVYAFDRVGGYRGLREKYGIAIPNSTLNIIHFLESAHLIANSLGNSTTISPFLLQSNTNNTSLYTSQTILSSLSNNETSIFPPIARFSHPSTTMATYNLSSVSHLRIALNELLHDPVLNSSIKQQAELALCGLPRANAWQMLRPANDPTMPWPGFIFGQTTASIWYWCADQMMVQRALAAKDISHAQGGTLFAGYLKMLPLFMIILPGMISRVLFTDIVACASPEDCSRICGNPTGCSNLAYPTLVLNLLPTGAKGLMLAVMLAALMSDLTSIFNSASTLFTMDIWKILRPKATVRELLITGRVNMNYSTMNLNCSRVNLRVFILLMTVIGIVWIPVIQALQGGQLYIYIQSIAAYLSPPIASVYLLAILWPRSNEKGAFWSLMVGMGVGITRMVLDFVYPEPVCGSHQFDRRPALVSRFHYMYFAIALFWITALVNIAVSLWTKPQAQKYLIRATYWSRFDDQPRPDDVEMDSEVKDIVYRVDSEPENNKIVSNGKSLEKNGHLNTNDDGLVNDNNNSNNNRIKATIIKNSPNSDMNNKEAVNLKDNTVIKQYPSRSTLLKIWDWFLGYSDTTEQQARENANRYELHLQHVTSLHQGPKAKLCLNLNLLLIIAIALFMFIYFTIY